MHEGRAPVGRVRRESVLDDTLGAKSGARRERSQLASPYELQTSLQHSVALLSLSSADSRACTATVDRSPGRSAIACEECRFVSLSCLTPFALLFDPFDRPFCM